MPQTKLVSPFALVLRSAAAAFSERLKFQPHGRRPVAGSGLPIELHANMRGAHGIARAWLAHDARKPSAWPTRDHDAIAWFETHFHQEALRQEDALSGAVAAGQAPDLRASAVVLSQSAFEVVVRGGALRARSMPSFAEFSDERLEELRHYIRQRANAGLPPRRPGQVP